MTTRIASNAFNRVYRFLSIEKRSQVFTFYSEKIGDKGRFHLLFEAYNNKNSQQIKDWDYDELLGLTAIALHEGTITEVQFGTMRVFKQVLSNRANQARFVPCFDDSCTIMRDEARKMLRASILYSATIGFKISKISWELFEELCSKLPSTEQGFFITKINPKELTKINRLNQITDPMGKYRISGLLRFKDDSEIYDIIPSVGLVHAYAETFFNIEKFFPQAIVGEVDAENAFRSLFGHRICRIIIPSGRELPPQLDDSSDPLDSYRHSIFLMHASTRLHPTACRIGRIIGTWVLNKVEEMDWFLNTFKQFDLFRSDCLQKSNERKRYKLLLTSIVNYGRQAFTVGFAPAYVGFLVLLQNYLSEESRKECLTRLSNHIAGDIGLKAIFQDSDSKIQQVLSSLNSYWPCNTEVEKRNSSVRSDYEFLKTRILESLWNTETHTGEYARQGRLAMDV